MICPFLTTKFAIFCAIKFCVATPCIIYKEKNKKKTCFFASPFEV